MRAIYIDLSIIKKGEELLVVKEKAKHLIQILRVRKDQEILILNGRGLRAIGFIDNISKKEVLIRVVKVIKEERALKQFSLAIGQLKKDAMDRVLRSSCELGLSKIIILETEYSQRYQVNLERAHKILISSLEQSNFSYLPELVFAKLSSIAEDDYDRAYVFSTEESLELHGKPNIESTHNLLIIGPEGGFSSGDLNLLRSLSKLSFHQLDTPIMRAPTAVSCCLGYLRAFC